MKAIGTLFLVLFFITVVVRALDGVNVFHTNLNEQDELALVEGSTASSSENMRRERQHHKYHESNDKHDAVRYYEYPSHPSSYREPMRDRASLYYEDGYQYSESYPSYSDPYYSEKGRYGGSYDYQSGDMHGYYEAPRMKYRETSRDFYYPREQHMSFSERYGFNSGNVYLPQHIPLCAAPGGGPGASYYYVPC